MIIPRITSVQKFWKRFTFWKLHNLGTFWKLSNGSVYIRNLRSLSFFTDASLRLTVDATWWNTIRTNIEIKHAWTIILSILFKLYQKARKLVDPCNKLDSMYSPWFITLRWALKETNLYFESLTTIFWSNKSTATVEYNYLHIK